MEATLGIAKAETLNSRLTLLTLTNGMIVRCESDEDSLWEVRTIYVANERGEV